MCLGWERCNSGEGLRSSAETVAEAVMGNVPPTAGSIAGTVKGWAHPDPVSLTGAGFGSVACWLIAFCLWVSTRVGEGLRLPHQLDWRLSVVIADVNAHRITNTTIEITSIVYSMVFKTLENLPIRNWVLVINCIMLIYIFRTQRDFFLTLWCNKYSLNDISPMFRKWIINLIIFAATFSLELTVSSYFSYWRIKFVLNR